MRPHRSRSGTTHAVTFAVTGVFLAALIVLSSRASAQDVAKEGALFLLVPVGARAVGQGQAVTASRIGADGVWWNPAALAWVTERQLSANYSKNFLVAGDAINAVLPAGRAGVLSASLLYFNFGNQDATDVFGATVGTLYTRAIVASATYAATFGDRVSAGLSYKYVQQGQSCGGSCPNADTYSASTSAFDFGMHAVLGLARSLTIGAVANNFGFCLQIIDTAQCDPLPTRLHLGADYRVDAVSKATPGAALHITGEVVTSSSFGSSALRVGAELGLSEKLFLRGGLSNGSGDGSKAAIGFGIRQGTLGLDFARTFGGSSSDAGEPPTYVTFRIAFR